MKDEMKNSILNAVSS